MRNPLERFVSIIYVRGVLQLSLAITIGWIVLLMLVEYVDKTHAITILHPIDWEFLQDWLNLILLGHIPILAFRCRPKWLTKFNMASLTAHWAAFALIIQASTWYEVSMKILVWIMCILVAVSYFRVELGDDI
jgi:hypothetical protein